MEEVYVVKVRSKPCASRLFPSERRYSASTVGGLGAIHLLLSLTCLLLGCLHLLALPGPVPGYGACLGLGAAAALSGLTGLLAWRRWYVDNNIRWFFISSNVSGLIALLCVALTAATLAESQEILNRLHLAESTRTTNVTATLLQDVVDYPAELPSPSSLPAVVMDDADLNATATLLQDYPAELLPSAQRVPSDDDDVGLPNDTAARLRQDVTKDEVRSVVAINIIVASTLELVWSALSVKIAWKGMRNLYPDEGESGSDKKEEEEKMKQKKEKAAMGDKPDIICNHKRRAAPRAEDRRDSGVSHEPMPKLAQDDGPCLPPMDRTMDFQEKIHRFLESNREHCHRMNTRDM